MKSSRFAKEVKNVCGISHSASRRRELRKIIGELVEWRCSEVDAIKEAIEAIFKESPLLGHNKDQILLNRASFPALRDVLSNKTCNAFLSEVFRYQKSYSLEEAADFAIYNLSNAMCYPTDHGVTNFRSKTQFEIGCHKEWPMNTVNDLSDACDPYIESSGDSEPSGDGEAKVAVALSTGINICDAYFWNENGAIPFNEVVEIVAGALKWDHVSTKAVFATIMSREENAPTDYDDITPDDFTISVVKGILVDAGSIEEDEAKAEPIEFDLSGPLKSSLDGLLSAATSGLITDADLLAKLLSEGAQAKEKAKELEEAVAKAVRPAATKVVSKEGEELPDGDVVYRKAYDVLGMRKRPSLNFDVPFFDWKTPHPMVPEIDDDYIFRPDPTLKALMGLVKGVNTYAVGHTGSGKTTLFTQLAARMQWPVIRVNFDSEITRLDLIGRDVLRSDPVTGVTVSEFIEGVLPTAIAGPFILLCDEVDRVRPEVSYVFQRALEDQGIMLNEDGGRLVSPHDWHRIVATANTVGQGDEFGLYQGARHQSQAFLDRFTNWIEIGYLSKTDETKLLKAKAPGIDEDAAKTIMDYVTEHRAAFVNAEILQPISARAIEQLGAQYMSYKTLMSDANKAMKLAFDSVVLVRGSATDRAVMTGLLDRVQRGEG
jgi:cobaltochelatase CobS subunit